MDEQKQHELLQVIEGALFAVSMARARGESISDQAEAIRVKRAVLDVLEPPEDRAEVERVMTSLRHQQVVVLPENPTTARYDDDPEPTPTSREIERVLDFIVGRVRDFDEQVAVYNSGGQFFSTAPLVGVIDMIRGHVQTGMAAEEVCRIWHTGDDAMMDDGEMGDAIFKLEEALRGRR